MELEKELTMVTEDLQSSEKEHAVESGNEEENGINSV